MARSVATALLAVWPSSTAPCLADPPRPGEVVGWGTIGISALPARPAGPFVAIAVGPNSAVFTWHAATSLTFQDAIFLPVTEPRRLWVAGRVRNAAADDFQVIQYEATDGTLRWAAAPYGAVTGRPDVPASIVAEPTGNSYTTGWSNNAASNNDYRTIKLSPTGSLLWPVPYNESGGLDEANDIVHAPDLSRVFAIGRSFKAGTTGIDFVTVCYTEP